MKLSLQSNRLTCMAGLESCTALQELYLSHNGIEQLEVIRMKLHISVPCINKIRVTLCAAQSVCGRIIGFGDVLHDNQYH